MRSVCTLSTHAASAPSNRPVWTRFARLVLLCGLLLGLSGGLTTPLLAAGPLPPLPEAYQAKSGSAMTLLTFYAAWCGACQRMKPVEQALAQEAGSRLRSIHLDLDDPANRPIARLYRVTGTPTYLIFDPQGKPLFHMTDYFSPSVLRAAVRRATGQLPQQAQPTPSMLKADQSAPLETPLRVVYIEPSGACPSCRGWRQQLGRLQSRYPQAVSLWMLDGRQKAVSAYRNRVGMNDLPGVLLLDRNGRELLRPAGDVSPEKALSWMALLVAGEVPSP